MRIEQKAIGLETVAARTPNLLVIALDVFRQVVVNDEAHVRFVDAHAKRNRRDDDLHVVTNEHLLVLCAHCIGKARVVGLYRKTA